MSNAGLFVISLDLELYWGMFDKVTIEAYGENIQGAHHAVPELLRLFEQNQIHATWASVGMLMFKNRASLLASLPPKHLQPQYSDMNLSSYEHLQKFPIGDDAQTDPYHFGSDLVEAILRTKNQELASHTFSHYYCLDGSENSNAVFAADSEAFDRAVQKYNVPITSIVFPRNQTSPSALRVCSARGIRAYRGTSNHFLYTGKKEKAQTSLFLRALRLIDAYVNISGHHTYNIFKLNQNSEQDILNIPGSRFLRPYSSRLKMLEKLRIKRVKDSMTHAAKKHETFHLWWHPHNFGTSRKENMAALLQIIEHYLLLHNRYGMQSATMSEIAIRANESVL